MKRSVLALVVVAAALFTRATPFAAGKAEILWDHYGVPHIFAADRPSMFYAQGWAQMQAQANLLLRLYGESRGRAAEYWGSPDDVALDRWVQLNGVPERAKEWYDAQDPTFRSYLDAFARGINDYAHAHIDTIAPEVRVVLPVIGRRCHRTSAPRRALRVHGVDDSPAQRSERLQARPRRSGDVARSAQEIEDEERFADRLEHLVDRAGAFGQRQRDAAHQPASGLGQHVLPLHGGPSRRAELRLVRRAADRIPRAGRRLQSPRRMGPHGEHDRHRRLLQAHRQGRAVHLRRQPRAFEPFDEDDQDQAA